MKKKYTAPEIEIKSFATVDIITTSVVTDDNTTNGSISTQSDGSVPPITDWSLIEKIV